MMPQSLKLTSAIVVAGLAGVVAATPASVSHASELTRLDEVQLDGVTAGASAGFSLLGSSFSRGSVQAREESITTITGNASPVATIVTGTTINTALGVGGAAPTATTNSVLGPPVDDQGDPINDANGNPFTGPVGTPVVIIPIVIQQSGPGFAFSVNALGVAYVATEFPGVVGF